MSTIQALRRRRAAGTIAVFVLIAQFLVPMVALAGQSWSITHGPTEIPEDTLSAVKVSITNTSSDDGGGKSIACVRLVIPVGFTVSSATIDSVSRSLSWSATVIGTGPTTILLKAADDNNRLQGKNDYDVLVATVNVTGDDPGSYLWVADELEKSDCTKDHNRTVNLAVEVGPPLNSAPVAAPDGYPVEENVGLVVAAPGVLSNDTDVDGDPLSVSLVSGPSNGTLVLVSNGYFDYLPDPGFAGMDSFMYEVSDGSLTDTGTVTLTVSNTAPVAGDDGGTVIHDRSLFVAAPGILANDMDANGHTLTAILSTGPTRGTLLLAADGSYTYTPDPGYVGSDSFTYRADDGKTTSSVATVDLSVTNAAPVGTGETLSTWRNTSLVVVAPGVLGNDTDPDTDALVAAVAANPANGALTLNADGSLSYDPSPGYVGLDAFAYTISDGIVVSAAINVSINVVDRAPTVTSHGFSVIHDRTLIVGAGAGVLVGPGDLDGDALTAAVVSGPSNGSLSLASDGSFTYNPAPGYVGMDAFTYKADDGILQSSETVSIEVTNVAPVAKADAWSLSAGGTLIVAAPGVLANDADADGDALKAALDLGPTYGSLSLGTNGSFTYAPTTGYSGVDSFTYRVSDGVSSSAAVTVDITIIPKPTPTPIATPPSTPTPVPTETPVPTPVSTPEPTPTPSPTPVPASSPVASTPPRPEPSSVHDTVDSFFVPAGETGPIQLAGVSLASALLGNLDAFMWAVPGLALSVPGLIVVLAIMAQALGGLAWLPIARRKIGGFDLFGNRRRRRARRD